MSYSRFLGLLLLPSLVLADVEKVTYTSARTDEGNREYFVELLQLALSTSKGSYDLVRYAQHMNQERQIKTVKDGEADVMWTMTTDARESVLLPVRFPLLKGYMGKRVSVIHRDNQALFPAHLSRHALQGKTAIQGLNWPDTKILRHNKFKVETVDWGNWYDNLFTLIRRKKGDYFPRSIIEAPLELTRLSDDVLVIEKHHLLIYPAYMYYFVTPAKPGLAKQLLSGLQDAQRSGQFDKLFFSFAHHVEAQKLLDQGARTHHQLKNPFLTVRH